MGFFSAVQQLFSNKEKINEDITIQSIVSEELPQEEEKELLNAIRTAHNSPKAWLEATIGGVEQIDTPLYTRLIFLLNTLGVKKEERDAFITELFLWVQSMGYTKSTQIRSEMQYRLTLLLGMEDEESEESVLLAKISEGLAKTRSTFTRRIQSLLLSSGDINEDFWDELEAIFLTSDMGYDASQKVLKELQKNVFTKEDFMPALEKLLEEIFSCKRRVVVQTKPKVIMVIGVNGAGKTTSVAKLAYKYTEQGNKVLIVAGDTFRAAAIEQLGVWAERLSCGFFAKEHGADSAAVAFEGVQKAQNEDYDIVLIDTAGRLHTKINLMEELAKVYRVIKKVIPEAPHSVMLVLDATIGQNALSQVELFNKTCPIDEVIFTKLDGTAKGGVAIAVALEFNLPITYIGLGEKMQDLEDFDAKQFTKALLE